MPRISGTVGIAQTIDITNATTDRALVFCGGGGYQPCCAPPYGFAGPGIPGCPGWPGCPNCPGCPYGCCGYGGG
ncbi:hypothetical protein GCM10010302_29020 [Streptomyces polychromogenes]|uniref:Uncharacterized protein n=1 Tax=Streptomyces polychromogenes TaxID=67342 RepID=A0ABP3F0L9_9ACTN